jgi:hypothetical protein
MRRGLAAAAAGAAVALGLGVGTAGAAPPGNPVVSGGHLSVAMSKDNTNPPLLSGHFDVDDNNATVTVSAKMSWKGPDPAHHPTFNPQNVCPSAQCNTDGNGNVDFAGFPLPAAAYNGPYHVDATATATNPLFGQGVGTAATDFQVAVPPPDVTKVSATVDTKTRIVTVSWDRDATTPDVQTYWILRKGPGDTAYKAIVQTPQQNTGARISVSDSNTQFKGGDYFYEVQARRNGGDGQYSSTDYVGSDPAKSQSPKVTVADPPPGVTAPPSTVPSKSGGAPPLVNGTASGGSRNSSFSGSSSGAAKTPTSEAVTPDPGFVRGLPDAGSNANDQNSSSEGDNSAVAVTPGRHKSAGKGILVPVAGAAVLLLGAVHMRYFKKRLDEPPSTLTPVS